MASQLNGGISVFDIQNRVDVSNSNGGIQISNIFGDVLADVVNGSIEGDVTLSANGVINLGTVNGSIGLSLPTNTSANFSASVNGVGGISVDNLTFAESTRAYLKNNVTG